jgi:hypothetical protein
LEAEAGGEGGAPRVAMWHFRRPTTERANEAIDGHHSPFHWLERGSFAIEQAFLPPLSALRILVSSEDPPFARLGVLGCMERGLAATLLAQTGRANFGSTSSPG